MKYYLILNADFTWYLASSSDLSSIRDEDTIYEELTYEEFIQYIDLVKGSVK